MPHQSTSTPTRGGLFARFWQSAGGFWSNSPASWSLAVLLIVIVLLELSVQYRLNIWNRDFFDALERGDGSEIWRQSVVFVPLVLASTTLAIVGVWSRMRAQRKWREWLSEHLIERWLGDDRYRHLHTAPGDHENPEYRIAEDARVATDAPVDFAVGLLTAVLTAITFINVLWVVGGELVVELSGRTIRLPGYLVIAAVVYASFTTSAMLLIGRRLVQVVERKNQAEAELRHAANRLSQNALQGGHARRSGGSGAALRAAMAQVIAQWQRLCEHLMRTTLVSHGRSLATPFVGLILCAPKYLAGIMSLGEVTQAAAAFTAVQASFGWLVDNYARLADWRSSVHRVASLLVALDALDGFEQPGFSGAPIAGERVISEFGLRDKG